MNFFWIISNPHSVKSNIRLQICTYTHTTIWFIAPEAFGSQQQSYGIFPSGYLTSLLGRIVNLDWLVSCQEQAFNIFYKCSIEWRLGLWEGHCRSLMLACLIHIKSSSDVCLGSSVEHSTLSKFQPSSCWSEVEDLGGSPTLHNQFKEIIKNPQNNHDYDESLNIWA